MPTKILIKRGSASQWSSSTTALSSGELGLDTTNNIIKVGDGSTLWNSLPGLTLTLTQVSELAQDALSTAFSNGTHSNIVVTYNDAGNAINLATGPDVVTTTSLNNTLTDPSSGYLQIADLSNKTGSGVAELVDGDLYIPSGNIIFEGTTDNSYELTLSSPDVTSDITLNLPNSNGTLALTSDVTSAVANLVNSAPATLDTLNELATALGNDANFSTTIATSLGNKLDSSTAASTYLTQSNASSTYAPKASPTFTGTVNGITASMVGLGNVDNTSDANKPISTATQTALNSKLDSSIFTYASITIPVYTAVGDLPSAASNHGRWAHVHGAGAMYFAHGGSWYRALYEEDEKNIYLTDSGTARTLGSGDAYKIIEFTNSNTIAVTIPNDASDTTFPIGSYVEVRQMGGGQITVSATSPATIVATDNQYKTRVQYSAIVLEKRASNAWYLAGDTTA